MFDKDDLFNFDLDGDNDAQDTLGDGYSEDDDLWMIDADEDSDDYDASGFEVDSFDLDGDGDSDIDIYSMDSDNDGDVDSIYGEVDLDGDGIADILTYETDFNDDGMVDYAEVELVTEDGLPNIVLSGEDVDFDGLADEFDIDLNDDDTYQQEPEDDTTYDDEDSYDYSDDEDVYDDEYEDDTEDEDYDDDDSSEVILPEIDYDPDADNGTYYEDLGHFDPDSADPDDVIGDPEDAMEYWEFQGDTGRCAVYAQKFVIEEFTGQEVDIEELCDIAEGNGWFDESSGTPLYCMDKLLDYYNVPNETSSGNDLGDIADALENDKKVIVAIDSGEVWAGESDTLYDPSDGMDHAIEVIGIDKSDPDNVMVIVNDSGAPEGCGIAIPAETFMDAWEDSSCYMIECM